MTTTSLHLLFALAGCLAPGQDSGSATGTTTFPSGAPDYCGEVSRAEVTDPLAPTGSATFPAGDALSAAVGAWSGPMSHGATLEVVVSEGAGGLWFVETELFSGYGGGHSPSESCTGFYELHLDSTWTTSDGGLAEAPELVVTAADPGEFQWFGAVLWESMVGTAAPESFDPAAWARTDLALDGHWDPTAGQVEGGFTWRASSDAGKAGGSGKGSTGKGSTGTVSTGTVPVSGVSEGWGSFALTR